MKKLEEILIKEIEKYEERFKYIPLAGKWLVFSTHNYTEYEMILDEEKKEVLIYEKARLRGVFKNGKDIAHFFKEELKIEDEILKRRKEILNWIQKVYPGARIEGFELKLGEKSILAYLNKHPSIDGNYQALYKDEVYSEENLDEVFNWLFQKVKKPIEKERLKNLFKENEA